MRIDLKIITDTEVGRYVLDTPTPETAAVATALRRLIRLDGGTAAVTAVAEPADPHAPLLAVIEAARRVDDEPAVADAVGVTPQTADPPIEISPGAWIEVVADEPRPRAVKPRSRASGKVCEIPDCGCTGKAHP